MTNTLSSTQLNDVNLSAVVDLAQRIGADADAGNTLWQAQVTWKGGFRSEAKVRQFDPIPSDEPVGLGGTDTAPNPVEQLLGALGNCLAVGYAANACAAGIEISELRIELEGDLDLHTFLGLAEGHAGYESIRAKVHLTPADPDADLDALHEKVVGSSPVGHTLQAAIPLAIDLAR